MAIADRVVKVPPEQLYRLARKCGRNLVAAVEQHIRKGEFFDGDELRLTTTIKFGVPRGHLPR